MNKDVIHEYVVNKNYSKKINPNSKKEFNGLVDLDSFLIEPLKERLIITKDNIDKNSESSSIYITSEIKNKIIKSLIDDKEVNSSKEDNNILVNTKLSDSIYKKDIKEIFNHIDNNRKLKDTGLDSKRITDYINSSYIRKSKFTNTREFKQDAEYFKKYNRYTHFNKNTKEYKNFWKERKRRCVEGYTNSSGFKINGYHYFYLNFCVIDKVERTKNGGSIKKEGFPDFWDIDYDYFWLISIIGGEVNKSEYLKLNLGFIVHPDDIEGKNHLVYTKARRKGASYKAASISTRDFHLIRGSKTYLYADNKEYVEKDGLIEKVQPMISFNDKNTAWSQPKLKNTIEEKISGYKEIKNGIEIPQGYLSKIITVIVEGKPNKVRGKDGDKIFYEEAGSFRRFLSCLQMSRPSLEQGKYITGTAIAYGTGGDVNNGEDLEFLFFNPKSEKCIRLLNIWSKFTTEKLDINDDDDVMRAGEYLGWCGYFVPEHMGYEGYIDNEGNSLVEPALNHILSKIPVTGDITSFLAEHAICPEHAFFRSDSYFDTAKISSFLSKIKHKEHYFNTRGELVGDFKLKENVVFKPKNLEYLDIYPIPVNYKSKGSVCIIETPYRSKDTGKIPDNMYIIACDPYSFDDAIFSKSVGVAYVIKRTNILSSTFPDCIVAHYIARPETMDDFNDNLFRLSNYYNAKICFENMTGNIVEFAKRNNVKYMLGLEPTLAFDVKLVSNVSRTYGVHMTNERKNRAISYSYDWLNEPIFLTEDNKIVTRLELCFEIGLLREFSYFNGKGNYDRISAILIAMLYLKELSYQNLKIEDSGSEELTLSQLFKNKVSYNLQIQ